MKKASQLGMNPGTASYRLTKDLLFDFVSKAGHRCHQCGGELARDNFSIEHKEPWLDSRDPSALFFDIANIAYSHLKCNFAAARKPMKIYQTPEDRKRANADIEKRRWQNMGPEQQSKRRREKYEKYGC